MLKTANLPTLRTTVVLGADGLPRLGLKIPGDHRSRVEALEAALTMEISVSGEMHLLLRFP